MRVPEQWHRSVLGFIFLLDKILEDNALHEAQKIAAIQVHLSNLEDVGRKLKVKA